MEEEKSKGAEFLADIIEECAKVSDKIRKRLPFNGNENLWCEGIFHIFDSEHSLEKIVTYAGDEDDKPVTFNGLLDWFKEETGQAGEEYLGVVYIMFDEPLKGFIYERGNEGDEMWHYHGSTCGYA